MKKKLDKKIKPAYEGDYSAYEVGLNRIVKRRVRKQKLEETDG